MQTNKIGKIAVGVDGHKQSSFDLTHDNETTYNFGVVKPLLYKEMKPHSKVRVKTNDIVLASPFNVMTIGRILYETLSFFVPRHKVFPRVDCYLTGEPMVAGNEGVESMSTVVSRPSCQAGILNLYTLIGAKLNVWIDDASYSGQSPEELITFNSDNAVDGRRFVFSPIELTGSEPAAGVKRSNIAYSLYSNLVGFSSDASNYRKILRGVKNNGGHWTKTASESTVNPNELGDFFNGTRSNMWFNLSMAGRLIQLNNFNKMTDVQKANFPSSYERIITQATGGDELTNVSIQENSIYIPLANSIEDAFGCYSEVSGVKRWLDPNSRAEIGRNPDEFVPVDLVTPQNADVIIPYHFDDVDGRTHLAFGCFRLSDAGKRLREIFKGLEMPTNVGYSRFFDCERLLAWYMAYYEAFGVQAFENIHNTPFGRLLETMRTHIAPVLNGLGGVIQDFPFNWNDDYRELSTFMLLNGHRDLKSFNHCVPFVLSLMDCWLTDSQDFMSVQQNNVVGNISSEGSDINPTSSALYDFLHKPTFGYSSKFLAPNEASNLIRGVTSFESSDGHLMGMPMQSSGALHTAIDSVLLLKVAKWINRQTVTGHNIQKILRVMGFGNALDQLGANFIGKTSVELNLQEVQASSDTYNSVSGDGHKLGELTTRSLTFNKQNKGQKYSTEDGGHWITMAYVRPVSTYSDSIDCEGMDCERSEEYIPDFDGLGMEFTPYAQFFNSGTMATVKGVLDDPSTETFGLVPRDSHRKVSRLVLNGGFFHNSQRGDYDSFHLNRRAPLGDLTHRTSFEDNLADFGKVIMGFARPLVLSDIPKAGIWTRSYYRYSWLANLERVFSGHATWSLKAYTSAKPEDGQYGSEYFTFSRDNFIVHTAILGDYRSAMKPIEVSYQTFEEGKDANGSITKE